MSQTDARSLQQIKRETEQTRAGLTDTVEQLRTSVAETASDIRQRISPGAIKAEVSDYIKSRGERLMNDVSAAARKNPIQAVAVGASVAYPLLRLARTIPVPILMVGAGLFFASSKTGQAVTQKASDVASDLSDEVGRRARDFGNKAGESAAAAKAYASDQLDRANAAVSGGTDQVIRAADAAGATLAFNSQKLQENFGASVSDSATPLRDEGLRRASLAATTAKDIASGTSSVARNAVGTAADAGLDAAKAARDKASDSTERAGKAFFETMEQNPLLVAGVGLLVGGLIAGALPRSDIEDGLVGDASTAVKRSTQTAASRGLDTAKNAVGEVYGETTRQAEVEGLTPGGLAKAAQDIGQRARRVAESAVTTAFEPLKKNHQPNPQGTDHG
jgi:ElaB/YqjD/DUF883 family membrane-anchored ribosome-binding protein